MRSSVRPRMCMNIHQPAETKGGQDTLGKNIFHPSLLQKDEGTESHKRIAGGVGNLDPNLILSILVGLPNVTIFVFQRYAQIHFGILGNLFAIDSNLQVTHCEPLLRGYFGFLRLNASKILMKISHGTLVKVTLITQTIRAEERLGLCSRTSQ